MAIDATDLLDGDGFEDEAIEDLDCGGVDLRDKSFYRCEFRNVSAIAANLIDYVLEACRLQGCDLTMAVLKGTGFRGVRFVDCKLMGVD